MTAPLPFGLQVAESWAVVPFGRLVDRSKEAGRPDAEPLSVFLDQGVVPRASREDNFNRLGADLANYLVVRKGDIVFNKLRTWQGGLGVSAFDGIVSPAYFVCRPRGSVEPRYLHYILRSQPYLEELTRLSKWMPPSQFDIAWDDLRTLPVPVPPQMAQRAIADYLDRETARIDALITAKQRMIELLQERAAVAFDAAAIDVGFRMPEQLDGATSLPAGFRLVRLSQTLIQLTNGYVGPTRDILVDDGVRYVQSLHIKNGGIDFDRGHYFVTPEWHAARPRIHLREGDVLIVQTGDIGQVAVVPPGFGEASCHALQIARTKTNLISGPYLAAYLRSPFGQASLRSRVTGALHPHLEAGIKDIPVIVPSKPVQDQIVGAVARIETWNSRAQSVVARQVSVLQERRQVVITEAVTAAVEVSAAA